MFRLLLVLVAALFATLQIAGQDRGQLRFGLIEARAQAEATRAPAQTSVTGNAPVTQSAQVAADVPARAPADEIVQATFIPITRLVTPVPAPKPADQPVETLPEQLGEIRYVTGRSVNVRSGPSRSEGVVGKLTRGEAVSVVWVEDNGWARVRVEGDGVEGFVSADFLSDVAP